MKVTITKTIALIDFHGDEAGAGMAIVADAIDKYRGETQTPAVVKQWLSHVGAAIRRGIQQEVDS